MHVAVTVDGDQPRSSTSRAPTTARRSRRGRRSATPAATRSRSSRASSTRRSRRTRASSTASTCACPSGTCVNPVEGKPVSSGTHHPGRRGRRRDRDRDVARSSPTAARRRPTSTAARARCGATRDPRTGKPFFDHGGEVNAGWVNAVKGVDGWGALVAVERQPHQGVGRDQRGALPAHPARPQLPHRLGRCRAVARRLRQPLRQGGAHADVRQPVRREPACTPIPGSPAATTARRTSCVLSRGHRPRGRGRRRRSPSALLETGERLVYDFGGGGGWGDPLRARPAGRARRRVGRVRVDRGRACATTAS